MAQAPRISSFVQDVIGFIERIREPARRVLEPEIRRVPAPDTDALYPLGAVDSSHTSLTTAGLCTVLVAAFRTSATNSEAHRFAHAHLDPGAEVEPVARIMRSHFEAELLCSSRQGGDRLLILDNSFLSLAMAASQASIRLERRDGGAMATEVLDTYVQAHLGSEGSLLELMRNARVVALPKVGAAQGFIDGLFAKLGVDGPDVHTTAAKAQHDRLLLRHVLAPGEYLAPRPLIPAGRAGEQPRRRFFPEFPGRAELMERFGVGAVENPNSGIDIVYFRPRRGEGCVEAPVMRAELHRPVARDPDRLHRVLLTLEDALDGEHIEPLPQLLADHYAKGAVRYAPAALVDSVMGDLLARGAGDDIDVLNILNSVFQEARS
jgi:hypothetical protein